MKSNTKLHILSQTTIFLTLYLLMSFVSLDINILNWHWFPRAAFVGLLFFFGIYMAQAVEATIYEAE